MTQVTQKAYSLCIGRDNGKGMLETLERNEGNNNIREHFKIARGKVVAYTVNDREYWIGD